MTVPAKIVSFSALDLFREGLKRQPAWPPFWRRGKPGSSYDVVIVGGGGHGLATAYYLAAQHGISNVAVLERGWLGGGNTARNTAIIRSNYLQTPSQHFYERSLRRYEGLSRELGLNIMFSQRGVLTLAFSRHDLRLMNRRVESLRHAGIDAEMVDVQTVQEMLPGVVIAAPSGRRIYGGFLQRRGGIARHDAIAWGYARAASRLGVDIIENCEVTGFDKAPDGAVKAVQTSRGTIAVQRLGIAVAGSSSLLANKLGFQLPIRSLSLQAMVTEPVKPALHCVLDGGFYVSQSDRGELVMGGGTDVYPSYAQRGGFTRAIDNASALLDLFPRFANLRLMRQWAGTVDVTPDSSPIISRTPVPNVYFNAGWGTYGFKAIPAGGECFATLLATGQSHPLAERFSLRRFADGALVDEAGSSGMDDRESLL